MTFSLVVVMQKAQGLCEARFRQKYAIGIDRFHGMILHE